MEEYINLRKTGKTIEMSDHFEISHINYFESIFPDNKIVDILYKDFLEWVLIVNKGKEKILNAIVNVVDYDYNNSRLKLLYNKTAMKHNIVDQNEFYNIKVIEDKSQFNLMNTDIIYKLEKFEEDEKSEIKWYKKGKFENLKTFAEFYKINEEYLLNKTKMDIAFEEAKKYFKALHKHASEEHLIDFMSGYLFNNYGIDFSHMKDNYKYVKHYVKHKIHKRKEKYDKEV
jgi:hypothetical protein